MKTLIVRPLGGLANRMRVIETATAYATNHSAEIIILWEKNNILNAYYEQCFEPLPNVKIINVDCSGNNFFFKLKRKIINRLFLWIGKFIFDIRLYDSTIRNFLNDDRTPKPEETFMAYFILFFRYFLTIFKGFEVPHSVKLSDSNTSLFKSEWAVIILSNKAEAPKVWP